MRASAFYLGVVVLICQIIPITAEVEKNAAKPLVFGFCNDITVNILCPIAVFSVVFTGFAALELAYGG